MKAVKDADYYMSEIAKLIKDAQSKGIEFGWADKQNIETGVQEIDLICQQDDTVCIFNENAFTHYCYIRKGWDIVGIKKD